MKFKLKKLRFLDLKIEMLRENKCDIKWIEEKRKILEERILVEE